MRVKPDVAVAVRSSATAEDTASASFAGMNETYLNTRGADAVVEAVKRCWGSLFGARTIYYRGQRGFSQADMDIAVVVQLQIASTRAGVMFTVDPASGERDRLVIEGSFGLGEAVVSGSVSPDRYVVRKSDLAITTRSVRPKELVIEPAEGGGTLTRELSAQESMQPVLSDVEVTQLANLGLAIEAALRQPPGHRVVVRPRRKRVDAAEPPDHDDRDACGAPPPDEVLVRGLGAAPGRASGSVRLLERPARHDASSTTAKCS